MRLLNRFTRDEVSAKVWWPLALTCVVALVASVPLANRAADQARADAASRAADASLASVEPLTHAGVAPADLTPVLVQLAADDPTVSAVRVWDAQHTLVASSDRTDQLGSGEALNDDEIDAAVENGSTWVLSDRRPSGDEGPTTFYAYTGIDGAAGVLVTQFEAVDATLLADVHQFWLAFRIAVGIATLLLLALAGLSMRESIAQMGANVPFYPESVPPWLAVMDVDRAVALEQAGDRAKDRLTGLQRRLDESERLRLQAEGELQQALTALSSGGRGMPVPASAAARPAGASRQPTPEAAAAAVAAAAAAAKARRAKLTEPAPVSEPEPVVADAEQPVVIPEPVVVPESVAQAEPVVIPEPAMPEPPAAVDPAPKHARTSEPILEPELEPEAIRVIADDVTVTATPVEAGHDDGGWPEVVVHPDPQPSRQAAALGAGSADSDAAVLDVLNRLVEPVGDPPTEDDQTDMRARLARTAALKKPGSRERREERERDEQ